MPNMTGVVEATARSGKALKIGEDWYSAFTASSLNGAKAGDNVSFMYTVTNKAGTEYKNIKGAVSIKDGGEAPAAASGGAKAPAASSGWSKGGRSFPVGPLDPERSIIRQNALTQANKMLEDLWIGESSADDETHAFRVIKVARIFESYSAGDLDAAEAEEAVEAVRSGMTRD